MRAVRRLTRMWRLPATLLVVVILLVDSSGQVRAAFDDDDDDTQVRLVDHITPPCKGSTVLRYRYFGKYPAMGSAQRSASYRCGA